jgi:glucose-6-phosphate isomerase
VVDAPVAAEAYATARAIRQRMGVLVRAGRQWRDRCGQRRHRWFRPWPAPGRRRAASGQRCAPARAFRIERGRRRHAAHAGHAGSAKTAGILISKTFGTQETLLNGQILHDWLGGSERLYAVSANPERAAKAFAIAADRVLPMWDWVGGRYSLWSAVGFPIALAIGFERFEQLLEGAAQMDAHALDAPLERNLPVLHGLTDIWNRNLLGHATHAVMTYDQRLALLPAYLQQLVMESLGKRVQRDGQPVTTDTVPVWWGGAGTDVQHSFFQALHQGTSIVPADFIGCVHNDDPYTINHQALLANLLAQTEALANGQSSDDPHRDYPGGRPSTLILLDALTPQALGALIAMYEHAVYVQSVIWNINAFDQFGVELGKQLASGLLPALQGEDVAIADPMTREILAQLKG